MILPVRSGSGQRGSVRVLGIATLVALLATTTVTVATATAASPVIARARAITPSMPLRTRFVAPTGVTAITFYARATRCAARTPVRLRVVVDGRTLGTFVLGSGQWRRLRLAQTVDPGAHRLAVRATAARTCRRASVGDVRLIAPYVPARGASGAPPEAPIPLGPRRFIPLGASVSWEVATRLDLARDRAFLGHFQGLTPENAMKMTFVEPQRGRFTWDQVDALMDFAGQQRRTVRGHPLIWNVQLPPWLTEKRWSRDDMMAIMREWIGAIVGRYRGRVTDWDVLNELFLGDGTWRPSPWYDSLGPDLAAAALTLARRADPGARLFINDYGIDVPGPKQDAVYTLAKQLKDAGAPLDGVGIQTHWSHETVPPAQVLRQSMLRFASLGLRVELTELDITIDHAPDALERQADAYAMTGRVCQSVPECDRITVWGISDKESWRQSVNRPLLLDYRYDEKPAYGALRRALDAG